MEWKFMYHLISFLSVLNLESSILLFCLPVFFTLSQSFCQSDMKHDTRFKEEDILCTQHSRYTYINTPKK